MSTLPPPTPATPVTAQTPAASEPTPLISEKKSRSSSESIHSDLKHAIPVTDPAVLAAREEAEIEAEKERSHRIWIKARPFVLTALALLILGWWISATILKATRHRWIVQTLWGWFFILVIAFRFIPNSVVSRPVGAIWSTVVSKPFFGLPRWTRLGLGWAALLGIVFGSAFGFPLPSGTGYGDRAISVLGLFVFQTAIYLSSTKRKHVPWPTVIIGLFMQQVIALFVLKTGAGYSIFNWIAKAAGDLLNCAYAGAAFFFDDDIVKNKHWFFVNVLSSIIFFIALVQMLYYLGVMQWIIGKFAWFFFKTMNVSGAEAVVAAASPFIGQGESACLVRPYVDIMTDSEIHLTMTSGFSTIAGSVLGAYIALGVPAQHLVTASVMSIPASIAISKLRFPETDEPVTRGAVVIDRGREDRQGKPANVLHAFSHGAMFGLVVAGQILANVLTILSLVFMLNGLLTWIGRGFGIHQLTIQLVLGYVFYPVTFLMGVPRSEILPVAKLLATKLVANEFVAYLDLVAGQAGPNPLSERAFLIASYALCGFANLGSLGIQIGVLSALAPSRGKAVAKLGPSAMICGFISTMQAAGIAGMLL